jgi:hypothetical protein
MSDAPSESAERIHLLVIEQHQPKPHLLCLRPFSFLPLVPYFKGASAWQGVRQYFS